MWFPDINLNKANVTRLVLLISRKYVKRLLLFKILNIYNLLMCHIEILPMQYATGEVQRNILGNKLCSLLFLYAFVQDSNCPLQLNALLKTVAVTCHM